MRSDNERSRQNNKINILSKEHGKWHNFHQFITSLTSTLTYVSTLSIDSKMGRKKFSSTTPHLIIFNNLILFTIMCTYTPIIISMNVKRIFSIHIEEQCLACQIVSVNLLLPTKLNHLCKNSLHDDEICFLDILKSYNGTKKLCVRQIFSFLRPFGVFGFCFFWQRKTKKNWTWFSLNDNNAPLFFKSYWNRLFHVPQYKLTPR